MKTVQTVDSIYCTTETAANGFRAVLRGYKSKQIVMFAPSELAALRKVRGTVLRTHGGVDQRLQAAALRTVQAEMEAAWTRQNAGSVGVSEPLNITPVVLAVPAATAPVPEDTEGATFDKRYRHAHYHLKQVPQLTSYYVYWFGTRRWLPDFGDAYTAAREMADRLHRPVLVFARERYGSRLPEEKNISFRTAAQVEPTGKVLGA